MEPEGSIQVFLSDFDQQVAQLQRIYEKLEKRKPALEKDTVSDESVESAGYWLHNLYCAYEDLFKIVSAFWENNIVENGAYHLGLLKRMLTKIEGVRPPLLTRDSYAGLDELRGFRHVFRYAYSYGLDDERVHFLLRRVLSKKDSVFRDLNAFRETIGGLSI